MNFPSGIVLVMSFTFFFLQYNLRLVKVSPKYSMIGSAGYGWNLVKSLLAIRTDSSGIPYSKGKSGSSKTSSSETSESDILLFIRMHPLALL
jgi:hypothetical protein